MNGLDWNRSRSPGSTRPASNTSTPTTRLTLEGLTKLTEQIEARKKLRNDIEQDTRVQIETKESRSQPEELRNRA